MTNLILKAIEIATKAHLNQIDKGGAPYINHPMRVSENVSGEYEKICAYLHDVIEDSPNWTLEDLLREGIPPECVEAIECLTKRPNENYGDFINRVSKNKLAIVVKIADINDNMDVSRLPSNLSDKDLIRLEKYRNAKKFLLSLISN